jgi:hypothetical protein
MYEEIIVPVFLLPVTGADISLGSSWLATLGPHVVVVDRLSKYGHFIALKGDYTSKSEAELFMIEIVKLHNIPKSI